MRALRSAAVVSSLALAVADLTSGLAAQQPPAFKAGNRTVAVYATVTAATNGRLVPDLEQDAFAVLDDGKPQELTLFSNDIQPITVIMLLDRSSSMAPNFKMEELAAEAFVNAMGRDDKARIGSFSTGIQIDPPEFTSAREEMLRILHNELLGEGPTPLWNAVDRGIDKLLLEPGRRVILVFTDGVDMPLNFSGGNKSLKDVTKRAEDNDVMVYAIGLAGQNGMAAGAARPGVPPGGFGRFGAPGANAGPGPGTLGMERPDEGLPKIAAATGGGYFELTSVKDLADTFARVANELHHQYALGFTPQKLDGKMHDITVRVTPSYLTARARKRYLAAKTPGTP